jgi:hypothetical protein
VSLWTDCGRLRKKYEEQKSNLRSVVTETSGVLPLFGVRHCYSCSKINSVIINCSSARRIPNKPGVKCRTQKLFVALPIKHATFCVRSGRI